MISRANSQRVCFELKSPALLIKGGTCPADELLLYQIPMDEDDSWRLCGCCFTTHKKTVQTISESLQVLWPSHRIQAASPTNAY